MWNQVGAWRFKLQSQKSLQRAFIYSCRTPVLLTVHKVLTLERDPQWSKYSVVEECSVSTIHLKTETTTRSSVSPLFTSTQHLLSSQKPYYGSLWMRLFPHWHANDSLYLSDILLFGLYSVKIFYQEPFLLAIQNFTLLLLIQTCGLLHGCM